MSQPPAPYDRQYNFTSYQTANPTAPLPGQKVDQELNAVRASLNATQSRLGEIQADDGTIRTSAMNIQVIAEEVEPLLTDAPILAVEQAGAQQVGLVNDAGDAKIADMLAILSSQNTQEAIAAKDAAESAADIAASSATLANGYAGSAQAYANTALQAKNSAIVHAQVAQDAAASIPLIVGPAGPQGQQGIPGVDGQNGQPGVDGQPGIQGPAGNAWVYRGEYNNGITYSQHDYVTFGGSSYVLKNFIGGAGYDPIGYPGSWQLVAQKGANGVASASFPLSYNSGTQNVSIDLSNYATLGYVDNKPGISNLAYSLNYFNPATPSWYDSPVYVYDAQQGYVNYNLQIASPSDVAVSSYAGYTVSFVASAGTSGVIYNHTQRTVTFEVDGMQGSGNLQDSFNWLNSQGSGWSFGGNLTTAYYVSSSELFGKQFLMSPLSSSISSTERFCNEKGLWSDFVSSVNALNLNGKLFGTGDGGTFKMYSYTEFAPAGQVAMLNGANFYGRVTMASPSSTTPNFNIGSINTSGNLVNSVPGDVWIGTWQMAYKTANGTLVYGAATNASNVFGSPQVIDTTSNTLAALRVTQKGTMPCLVVEDSINPDATALVVDTSGNVGIGVATGFSATAKLDVVGNSKATTFSNGSGPTFSVNSTTSHSGGSDTLDLLVTIGGVNYRIGLRPA